MKKKHLKLGSCALMASLLTLSSCVDNDYDLTKDIDLTIQVGGSEFAIPGGETEPIKLSKILDIEEDGVVKIDNEGNYYLLQEGTQSTTDISVAGFQVQSPSINPIKPTLNFYIPPMTGLPPTDISADLPEEKTNFELKGENLPADITSLSFIDMDMEAVIHFSIPTDIISKLTLEKVKLSFPKFISSPKLTNGVFSLPKEIIYTDGLTVIIPIDGINCKEDGVTFTKGDEYSQLLMGGTISLDGEVSINTGDVLGSTGNVSVNLTVNITLRDKQSQQPFISIASVTGIVQPKIDINIDPVTLSGLPDFLDDEKVKLSVRNPMVFFMAKNNTPVAANVNGTIKSFINKEGGGRETVGDSENNPVRFAFKLEKEKEQEFCLSPFDPVKEGVTHVIVTDLPRLIDRIPDIFEFEVNADATTDETTVELGRTYNITTDYDVNVPFVFGKNITTIVYKDSVDGWYDDLKDYEIQQVNATATAFNTIPLGLNLTAKALTVDNQGKAEELKGVAITVIVDGKKDGTIKAGENNTVTESTLVIEIKETTSGAVKRLDGLAFEIVAASAEDAEGQQLNENQTLQLKNVRLKVPNGVIIDLN